MLINHTCDCDKVLYSRIKHTQARVIGSQTLNFFVPVLVTIVAIQGALKEILSSLFLADYTSAIIIETLKDVLRERGRRLLQFIRFCPFSFYTSLIPVNLVPDNSRRKSQAKKKKNILLFHECRAWRKSRGMKYSN